MIKAINKQGMISEFTERVWGMMSKNHNGYQEISDNPKTTIIPDKIIEFKAKKPELVSEVPHVPEVHSEPHKSDAAAEMAIMKEYLDSVGVKYHPATGYDKLKAKYDANKKP